MMKSRLTNVSGAVSSSKAVSLSPTASGSFVHVKSVLLLKQLANVSTIYQSRKSITSKWLAKAVSPHLAISSKLKSQEKAV